MANQRTELEKRLRLPLALTRAGLAGERVVRAFWPLWTLAIAVAAALLLGLQDEFAVETVWAVTVVVTLGALWLAWRGLRLFRWPSRSEALTRLDGAMPGRPIAAAMDAQAIGAGDAASRAVWAAHQRRMSERAAKAQAPPPDLRVSGLDPFALRYVALVALCVAFLFGSFSRVGSITGMAPSGTDMASGPTWEGWIAPPDYTGLPVLYMADLDADAPVKVPEGSQITLRLYSPSNALSINETVSGRIGDLPPATEPMQEFTVVRGGEVSIIGPGGWAWQLNVLADAAPEAFVSGPAEVSADGQMSLPFAAMDDYGVTGGRVLIALDLDGVDRRYGLAIPPEPRPQIELPLPLPITGNRADFTEALVDNFSRHPWANLPVTVTLLPVDALEQEGAGEVAHIPLPARRFFDPVAGALIEQRRDLLWNRENAPRVAQLLRTIAHRPEEELFRKSSRYLQLRAIITGLERDSTAGLTTEARDTLADALWSLAMEIEEGDLDDARQRMAEAQERLQEAMKNGASKEEIARLMQELRDATNDYMRMLAQEQQRDAEANEDMAMGDNTMQMNQGDLQAMMDRIQELMEQGRMAEAQEALRELQELMENLRIARGQGGGPQSPGEQAMEGLSETLRDQQELSDEAFRDLQERFNPPRDQQGEQQGQQQGQQEGQQGQQGQQMPGQRGQQGQGQPGQGQQPGGQPGQQGEQGQKGQEFAEGQGQGQGEGDLRGNLADRQRQLQQELQRQQGNLPGTGSEAGRDARDALDRAGRAMGEAEDALRKDDLAEAIDRQAEAMDALRDGLRNLGEAMAEAGGRQQEGQGQNQQAGQPGAGQRDPLGRRQGSQGAIGGDADTQVPDEDSRRAQDLLDEIRRRSFQRERPEWELDYLRRLYERF